jgi:polyisoprenoid-binding protein YceI
MKILPATIVLLLISAVSYVYLVDDPVAAVQAAPLPEPANTVTFAIDASKSQFMVLADRWGLLYFKGHSHRIAVRDFGGNATLSLDSIQPASLELNIRASSVEETSDVFTAKQKGIINKELNDIVLETAKYPTISFKSTEVTGKIRNGAFEVKIGGDITLHGVTRHIVIPATVTADGDTLRAKGEFKLDRKKFGVNATKAFHGTVRIRHTLKFTFDIVGKRV